jgi:hypothetical protein
MGRRSRPGPGHACRSRSTQLSKSETIQVWRPVSATPVTSDLRYEHTLGRTARVAQGCEVGHPKVDVELFWIDMHSWRLRHERNIAIRSCEAAVRDSFGDPLSDGLSPTRTNRYSVSFGNANLKSETCDGVLAHAWSLTVVAIGSRLHSKTSASRRELPAASLDDRMGWFCSGQ